MSESDTPDPIQTPFCGDLRSKRFLMLDTIPTSAEQYMDPSMHCWCYHTQQVIGPDGGFVGPEDCVPGRSCYRSALATDESEGMGATDE
jgi:hypothetical protein